MKLDDLITPSLIDELHTVLCLGLKPDSFVAEALMARSSPGGKREGGNKTLVDVLFSKLGLGVEMKCTGTIKSKPFKNKPDGKNVFEHDGKWVSVPDEAMVFTRRPNVDCFSEISALEGINHTIARLWEFYEKSKERHGCQEIYSLLVQHNWEEGKESTVFDFSLSPFSLPTVVRAERVGNKLIGYDDQGKVCCTHFAFNKGSQNFLKLYKVHDDRKTVIIKHEITPPKTLSWNDVASFTVFPDLL